MSKRLSELERIAAYRDWERVYVEEIREKTQSYGDRSLGRDWSGESHVVEGR